MGALTAFEKVERYYCLALRAKRKTKHVEKYKVLSYAFRYMRLKWNRRARFLMDCNLRLQWKITQPLFHFSSSPAGCDGLLRGGLRGRQGGHPRLGLDPARAEQGGQGLRRGPPADGGRGVDAGPEAAGAARGGPAARLQGGRQAGPRSGGQLLGQFLKVMNSESRP